MTLEELPKENLNIIENSKGKEFLVENESRCSVCTHPLVDTINKMYVENNHSIKEIHRRIKSYAFKHNMGSLSYNSLRRHFNRHISPYFEGSTDLISNEVMLSEEDTRSILSSVVMDLGPEEIIALRECWNKKINTEDILAVQPSILRNVILKAIKLSLPHRYEEIQEKIEDTFRSKYPEYKPNEWKEVEVKIYE